MEITEERRADGLVLHVIGKLNASTSKGLEAKLLALIAAGQEKLVIDLSQLDYVSSAGLHVFLLGAKRMEEAKGRIILCSLKPEIKHVFDIAGASSLLTLAASIEEASKNL